MMLIRLRLCLRLRLTPSSFLHLLLLSLSLSLSIVSCTIPTPIYDKKWTTSADFETDRVAYGAIQWNAGSGANLGYVETNDINNGGYVEYSGVSIPSLPFSVRFKVLIGSTQPTGGNGYQRVFEMSSGSSGVDSIYMIRNAQSNDLIIGLRGNPPASSVLNHIYNGKWLALSGGWHDIVITYTDLTVANGFRLYIDGVIVPQDGSWAVFSNTDAVNTFRDGITRSIRLGQSSYAGDSLMNGAWDLFQIYSGALTLQQINDLFTGAGVAGDPMISGLQGQYFQYHGIPNEIFNLITTPHLHVNSRFIYLNKSPSGPCRYNHTTCWSHPGTYISAVGIRIPKHTIQIRAHHHGKGLTLMIDGEAQTVNSTITYDQDTVADVEDDITISFSSYDHVEFHSSMFDITFINSDGFMNLQVRLRDTFILDAGSKYHHFTQSRIKEDLNNDIYPDLPIHGLIGQTWRNAVYGASKSAVEGDRDSYLVSSGDLFGIDCEFNHYQN